jgi:hypothetical protein
VENEENYIVSCIINGYNFPERLIDDYCFRCCYAKIRGAKMQSNGDFLCSNTYVHVGRFYPSTLHCNLCFLKRLFYTKNSDKK